MSQFLLVRNPGQAQLSIFLLSIYSKANNQGCISLKGSVGERCIFTHVVLARILFFMGHLTEDLCSPLVDGRSLPQVLATWAPLKSSSEHGSCFPQGEQKRVQNPISRVTFHCCRILFVRSSYKSSPHSIEGDYTGVTTIGGHLGHPSSCLPEKARHLISNASPNPFLKSPRKTEHISDSSEDFNNYGFVALTNLDINWNELYHLNLSERRIILQINYFLREILIAIYTMFC